DGSTGQLRNSTTTDSSGSYKINGLSPGDWVIRVVASSVSSSRPGYLAGGHLAVPTFRIDERENIITPITNEVGGHEPSQPDPGNAGSSPRIHVNTFRFIS